MRPARAGPEKHTRKPSMRATVRIRMRAVRLERDTRAAWTPSRGPSLRVCACPGSVRALTAPGALSAPSRACGGRARGRVPCARPWAAPRAGAAPAPRRCACQAQRHLARRAQAPLVGAVLVHQASVPGGPEGGEGAGSR